MFENYWFILTLSVTIAIGIVAFINKIFAKRKYDPKFASIILYGVMTVFSLIYLIYKGNFDISLQSVILSIIFGIQTYTYSLIMMNALRYIPTSTYFISVRLSSSFALLLIGIIIFKDKISQMEIIGFILGILAMIFLFEKEERQNTNYKKGIIILILGILSLVVGHTISKVFSSNLSETPTILLITFFTSFTCSIIFGYKNIKENLKDFTPILKLNLIQGIFFMFYFVNLFSAYKIGNLGISYKIQSYSPFIPIILALIVYKEKITKKKIIAFILTALSLWFFV